MSEAVVVAACRTAVGTAFKGTLVRTGPQELAEAVVAEAVRRSGLPAEAFDDLLLGESRYGGGDIARHVAVTTGLTSVPGAAVNRHCASGLTTVAMAAAGIRAGMEDAVIAGGTQSSSTAPVLRLRDPQTGKWQDPWNSPAHPSTPTTPNDDMSVAVGWNAARLTGLTREEMDAGALRSHQRAVAAIDEGLFREEIVPVKALLADGSYAVFDIDEHPRRDTSMEKLAKLRPLHPEIEGFSITAGNSSGINDAAAALALTSDALAASNGLSPLAVVRGWASIGVDPEFTGLAPADAVRKALRRSGVALDAVNLFEINEAFASVAVAATRALDIDPGIVNIHGSGCSIGHPIAASGARMLTTLVHDLRRRGGGIGVAAMCAAGGQATAVVVEA
ncbi:thiolase family protein [Streptomyces sp. NPDC021080]|uniref:thiolase family protein n=1 Tax=Streptomyces sp. NPDC021080 TaxID=3365110 RepID=UPI003789F608